MTLEDWIVIPRPISEPHCRLFCFPHAGTGCSIFRPWPLQLQKLSAVTTEVCLVQLPGRENRYKEPLIKDMDDLVTNLVDVLSNYIDRPFAFFGHSLGGLISFELARKLRRRDLPNPLHLIVSGCRAPQVPDPDNPIHHLPEIEFIEALRQINGTPDSVLNNPNAMQIYLPALYGDFTMLETYTYRVEPPLSIPISAFGGYQDREASFDSIERWKTQTTKNFHITMCPSNHFFLHSQRAMLLQNICNILKQHNIT